MKRCSLFVSDIALNDDLLGPGQRRRGGAHAAEAARVQSGAGIGIVCGRFGLRGMSTAALEPLEQYFFVAKTLQGFVDIGSGEDTFWSTYMG